MRVSPALAEPVTQKIFQVVDPIDLLDRGLHVVLDAAEADRLVVEQDVASPPVAVARLADGADVAERLAAVELVRVLDLFRAVELQALGEDARDVGMALGPVAVDEREDPLHLTLVVDVFGEDVLVERVAGRAVDVEEALLAVRTRPLGEELPAASDHVAVAGAILELRPCPEDGALGGRVEAF